MKLGNRSVSLQTAIVLCAVLLYCGGIVLAQDVRYNYVPGTDFAKFKTYKWVEIKGAEQPNQILDGQIKAAIDSQLAQKGLTKTEGDDADLYVAYQVAINQQTEWNTYQTGGGWYWGGMATTTSSTINVGTLVVNLFDTAAKRLVWRGDATKTLNPSKDPQKNQERLQKAVAKLLKNYPPRAK